MAELKTNAITFWVAIVLIGVLVILFLVWQPRKSESHLHPPLLIKEPKGFPKGWEYLGVIGDPHCSLPEWANRIYNTFETQRIYTSPHGGGCLEYIRGKYFEYAIRDGTDAYKRPRRRHGK